MTDNTDNYIDIDAMEQVQQQESGASESVPTQAEPIEEKEKDDSVARKSQMWANWRIFVAPGRIRERARKLHDDVEKAVNTEINTNSQADISEQNQNETDSNEDSEDDNSDRFIPKNKDGRLAGLINYIRYEDGAISIEEMLCIDLILQRDVSLTPQTPGIDRYDDWGVGQWSQGLREFAEHFFRMSTQEREKKGTDYEDAGQFSPEISWRYKRLSRMFHLPESKQANHVASQERESLERLWPDRLNGRNLELFKMLSGLETLSPRRQALSILDYVLPDENNPDENKKCEGGNPVKVQQTLQFVPEDKARIKALLKQFPILHERYPYLLNVIENDLPIESFCADTNSDYLTIRLSPAPFFFPIALASSIQSYKQPLCDKMADWISKGLFIGFGVILIIGAILKLLGFGD